MLTFYQKEYLSIFGLFITDFQKWDYWHMYKNISKAFTIYSKVFYRKGILMYNATTLKTFIKEILLRFKKKATLMNKKGSSV